MAASIKQRTRDGFRMGSPEIGAVVRSISPTVKERISDDGARGRGARGRRGKGEFVAPSPLSPRPVSQDEFSFDRRTTPRRREECGCRD